MTQIELIYADLFDGNHADRFLPHFFVVSICALVELCLRRTLEQKEF
jgi:hypothetical protein